MPRPTQVPTGLVSGLRVRGFHLLRPRVPARSTDPDSTWRRSYNPGTCLATPPVWAPPRSLAATGGIVVTFSSWRYLDVSVPTVRLPLCGMPGSLPAGCPIRTSADHWAFAPPRGFSQLVTSFFASESPGIPHAPFRLRCALPESGILLPNSGVHSAPRAFSAYLGSLVVSSSGRPAHPRRRPRDLRFASSMSMSFLRGASRTNPGRPAGSVFLSVENNGFEPLTPCLQSRCSSQLS